MGDCIADRDTLKWLPSLSLNRDGLTADANVGIIAVWNGSAPYWRRFGAALGKF